MRYSIGTIDRRDLKMSLPESPKSDNLAEIQTLRKALLAQMHALDEQTQSMKQAALRQLVDPQWMKAKPAEQIQKLQGLTACYAKTLEATSAKSAEVIAADLLKQEKIVADTRLPVSQGSTDIIGVDFFGRSINIEHKIHNSEVKQTGKIKEIVTQNSRDRETSSSTDDAKGEEKERISVITFTDKTKLQRYFQDALTTRDRLKLASSITKLLKGRDPKIPGVFRVSSELMKTSRITQIKEQTLYLIIPTDACIYLAECSIKPHSGDPNCFTAKLQGFPAICLPAKDNVNIPTSSLLEQQIQTQQSRPDPSTRFSTPQPLRASQIELFRSSTMSRSSSSASPSSTLSFDTVTSDAQSSSGEAKSKRQKISSDPSSSSTSSSGGKGSR